MPSYLTNFYSPFSTTHSALSPVGNDMTAVQAQELAELLLLPHMSGLRELSLDDNELESEGAVFLAKGVRVRYKLTRCLHWYLPACPTGPPSGYHHGNPWKA